SGRGGPMVPPGTYRARLKVGDWSRTRSFTVRLDPRVAKEGVTLADVTAQAELALRVRDTLSAARLQVARLQRAEQEVEGAETAGAESLRKGLAAIHKQLLTAPVRYSPPMLVDQLQYLYGNLNRADQLPGDDAVRRHEELRTELEGITHNLEALLRTLSGSG
ncbi:MAG: hypothetical protein ACE5HV_17620, partial [Acidobacteriota bacterium]